MKRGLFSVKKVFSVLLAGAALLLPSCKSPEPSDPDTSIPTGGEEVFYDPDAPKTVTSDDLSGFSLRVCAFGLSTEVSGQNYFTLQLDDNGGFRGSYRFDPLEGADRQEYTFEADAAFAARVQQLIRRYDLAANNGYRCVADGLPEEFGYDIDVTYADGERISVSTNASHDSFPENAFLAFYELFAEACGIAETGLIQFCDAFMVTLPENWRGKYVCEKTETQLTLSHKQAEAEFDGTYSPLLCILSLTQFPLEEETMRGDSTVDLCTLTSSTGDYYHVTLYRNSEASFPARYAQEMEEMLLALGNVFMWVYPLGDYRFVPVE